MNLLPWCASVGFDGGGLVVMVPVPPWIYDRRTGKSQPYAGFDVLVIFSDNQQVS